MEQRFFYLDTLRTFCMTFGIFVHANVLFFDRPFPWVQLASGYFRMATFFVVSGFFASLVIGRLGDRGFIKNRVRALLVPLIAIMILLNPVTNYLLYVRFDEPVSLADYFLKGLWRMPTESPGSAFLHLWFLFVLVIFVLLSPWMSRLLEGALGSKVAQMLIVQRPVVMLVTLAVGLAAGAVAGRIVFEVALETWVIGTAFNFVTRQTLAYLPFFFLGLFIYHHRDVFDRFHNANPLLLALAAGWMVIETRFGEYFVGKVGAVLQIAGHALATTIFVAALFWVFRRYGNADVPIVRVATQSMYTIYLFHYVMLLSFGIILENFISNRYLLYAVMVVLVIVLGLLLHRRIVAPYPLLTLLFNGRVLSTLTRAAPLADR